MIEYSELLEGSRGVSLEQKKEIGDIDEDQATTSISKAWSSSLEDLAEELKLESFQPVAKSVATMLKKRVFTNTRELELKLIYDGWVSERRMPKSQLIGFR